MALTTSDSSGDSNKSRILSMSSVLVKLAFSSFFPMSLRKEVVSCVKF